VIKGWRKAYHEIGQFMASRGANNELFSDFESIASEINKLEARIEELEADKGKLIDGISKMTDDLDAVSADLISEQQETIATLREDMNWMVDEFLKVDRANGKLLLEMRKRTALKKAFGEKENNDGIS